MSGSQAPSAGWGTPSLLMVGLGIVAVPVGLVGGALAIQYMRQLKDRWVHRHIPGPPKGLLVGNIPQMFAKGGNHLAIEEWIQEYGSVFQISLMTRTLVVVADPDMARSLMYKMVNHSYLAVVPPGPIEMVQGPNILLTPLGLVSARDAVWRMLRNAWQPAFAPGTLKHYSSLMVSCAEQLCDLLLASPAAAPTPTNGHTNGHTNGLTNGLTNGKAAEANSAVKGGLTTAAEAAAGEEGCYVDLHEFLMNLTLEVVGSCAYGVRFHALVDKGPGGEDAPGHKLTHSVKDYFQAASFKHGSRWNLAMALLPPLSYLMVPFAILLPDAPMKRVKQAGVTIRKTASSLIRDWHSKKDVPTTITSNTAQQGKAAPAGLLQGVDKGSFLGLMLGAQAKSAASESTVAPMNNEMVTVQANVFILAGTETTATLLTFAVYLLSQHPEVQARLIREVDAHDWSVPITSEGKFPYVDAVISESMRVFPPAHSTSRDVEKPGGVEVLGYHLPHKTAVLVPIYSFHHSPKYWPRAQEFLPERWLPEGQEFGPTNPNAYIPFGAGTRQCPGYKFALQEARIALVHLYKTFTFELAPGQVPLVCMAGITLTPRNGLRVRPVPRRHAVAVTA